MAVENFDKERRPNFNRGYVDVDATEAVGVVILGFLLFLVLMALLRSQRRERKLLREIANLHARSA